MINFFGVIAIYSTIIGGNPNNFFNYNIYEDTSIHRYITKGICFNNIKYEPENLIKIEEYFGKEGNVIVNYDLCKGGCMIRKDIIKNIEEFANLYYETYKKKIIINSGYRSYQEQKDLLDFYTKTYGKEKAKNYVSLPGASEHQTGLAFDMLIGKMTEEEYRWISDNSVKFGFHKTYQHGKEKDGYDGEKWHFRYIGNLSIELRTKKITLGEYLYYDYNKYSNYECKENNEEYNNNLFESIKINYTLNNNSIKENIKE